MESNNREDQPSVSSDNDTKTTNTNNTMESQKDHQNPSALPPSPASNPSTKLPTDNQSQTPATGLSSPFIIILQWLTYAFWGWVVIALAFLIGSNLYYFINKEDVTGFVPYSIAAVLVLLPIALLCDYFYSKHEPTKKSGATAVIMVIHAVIFALLGVGAMMTAIFLIIRLLIGSNDSTITGILTATIVTLLYATVLVRTINPQNRIQNISKITKIIMVVTMVISIIVTIAGPIAKGYTLKQDKIIDNSLPDISSTINQYANKNKKLPASLSDLTFSDSSYDKGAKDLVSKKLVEYKPITISETLNQTPEIFNDDDSTTLQFRKPSSSMSTDLKYELCVNYISKSANYGKYNDYYTEDDYRNYPDTYTHPAGHYCYKIKTTISTDSKIY